MDRIIAEITSFDFYYDVRFWLAFVVLVMIFRLVSFNERIRNFLLLLSSVLMVLALPRFNTFTLSFMFIISSFSFFAGYLLNTENLISDKRKRILVSFVGIATVIVILSFFKYTFLQRIIYIHMSNLKGSAPDYIFLIGISYSSFKMMHFIVECYKKKIRQMTFLNFVNYIFFFPAFISGPINRYNHFCKQLDFENRSALRTDLARGTERIIHGMFKKLVLSTTVYPYALINIQPSVSELSGFKIILGLYAYTLYFYFDFAGYSDIAIGSARIMGIELPENFNFPLLKKNIQQLWANWHMSLTKWLTDYIYWPLTKKLRKNSFFRKRPVFLSNISIFITFVVCGMWHGEGINFVIWGAYHGLGLATLNVYQKQKRKVRNGVLRKYFSSRYSQWIGVVGTFHFFVLGLLFFALDIDKLGALFLRILGM